MGLEKPVIGFHRRLGHETRRADIEYFVEFLQHAQLPGNILRMCARPVGENEFFFENKDGRIVLLFPMQDKVLIGTDYSPDDTSSPEYDMEVVQGFLHMTDEQFFCINQFCHVGSVGGG